MLPRREALTLSADRPRDDGAALASPPAARQRSGRWRDPRLWLGVLLVLGSVVAGAKVLASVDDTVSVWQLAHDVPAGAAVDTGDLRVVHVHFDEASVAQGYVLVTDPVAPGAHAARDLRAGELLPASGLTSGVSPLPRQLPLGVGPAHAPADLHPGDHVDVWAVSAAAAGPDARRPEPVLALHDVVVLSVAGDAAGLSGERQVLVGLGASVDVGAVLRQTTGSSIVLVRLAG